jgi:hypothetical protein
VIIGAEETHITLSQIRWAKEILGIIVPIPLNVIPLPAKWKIQFLKPIRIPMEPERVSDIKYATVLSRQVRIEMQKALHKALAKRKTIYL